MSLHENDEIEYRIIWTPDCMNAYRFEQVAPTEADEVSS